MGFKNGYEKNLYLFLFFLLSLILFTSIPSPPVNADTSNSTNQTNQTNYSARVDQEVLKGFEEGTPVMEVFVRYVSDDNITLENEEEMVPLYLENITIPTSFFGYIPKGEMNITEARLSALKPSFIAQLNKQGFEKLARDSRVTSIGIMIEVTAFGNQTNYSARVDQEVLKAFENYNQIKIYVIYRGDIPITEQNELEMINYYQNISITKAFFSSIPEAELNITRSALSALQPSFIAFATIDGFHELLNNSRVTEVHLEKIGSVASNLSLPKSNQSLDSAPMKAGTNPKIFWIALFIFLFLLAVFLLSRKKNRSTNA